MIRRLSLCFVSSVAAIAFLLCVPVTQADDSNFDWPNEVHFNSPTEIGELTLQPGSYELQLDSDPFCRNVVKIYNRSQRRWEGMANGIFVYRQDVPGVAKGRELTFTTDGKTGNKALKYWFYNEWGQGIEFVYPDNQTLQLAQK